MILLNLIPTHTVASWLLKTIDGFLNHIGLANHQIVEEVIYVVLISLFSLGIGIGVKKLILLITNKVMIIKQSPMAIELHNRRVFIKCSHIIPPLVFMALIPFAFNETSSVLHWIYKIVGIYTLIAFAMGTCAILEFIFDRYNLKENRRNLPLRGVLNIAIGIVWIVILILCICILINKSPGAILAGLGAFAAALMLVFKDSILGFVAGIQMSDNDMLHVGDWIVVPGTPANGTVMDVSLSTVKVQNWDLTTVMVPPYTLVSTSFQNYKSMYDANARRIENSFIIDINSVKTLTDADVDAIVAKYPILSDFVASLRKAGQVARNVGDQRANNGTIETNLGLFRAYVGIYLTNNPNISADQRVMVRIMQGSNAGIPLQIWCFTASTNWDEYEGVQSQIMEHLSAVIGDFAGLTVYASNDIEVGSAPSHPGIKPTASVTAKVTPEAGTASGGTPSTSTPSGATTPAS